MHKKPVERIQDHGDVMLCVTSKELSELVSGQSDFSCMPKKREMKLSSHEKINA